MGAEGKGAILMSEALASHVYSASPVYSSALGDVPAVRSTKIPVALSPDDLNDLTAALASYIERQNFAAVGD